MAADIVEQCRDHAAAFSAGGVASSLSGIFRDAADEIERLRKIEAAARALKFAAYPVHGSGFVMQVSGGNINDLEAALAAE